MNKNDISINKNDNTLYIKLPTLLDKTNAPLVSKSINSYLDKYINLFSQID